MLGLCDVHTVYADAARAAAIAPGPNAPMLLGLNVWLQNAFTSLSLQKLILSDPCQMCSWIQIHR